MSAWNDLMAKPLRPENSSKCKTGHFNPITVNRFLNLVWVFKGLDCLPSDMGLIAEGMESH